MTTPPAPSSKPKTPQIWPILPPRPEPQHTPQPSTSAAGSSNTRSDRNSTSYIAHKQVMEEQTNAYLEHPYMVKFKNKKTQNFSSDGRVVRTWG